MNSHPIKEIIQACDKAISAKNYDELMQTNGADDFAARVACVIQGSTETTFYVLAVYFGSVAIKKTRHAVSCALLAELAGVIAAICVAYVFWG